MKKPLIGVLGVGEVGAAIALIFSKKFKVLKKDINYDEIKNERIDVLHVCIPYSKKFENIVVENVKKIKPNLIIIHSTVKPETTSNIFKKTKIPIVHSPVMGIHPNLHKHILTFIKFIGPTNKKADMLAKKHFSAVGIKTYSFNNPIETETAKLLDSAYYAWNIIFNKLAADICARLKLDFNNVYAKFNLAYNEGYKISNPNVMRPVLKFKNGPIGGHCVVPNVEILKQFFNSPISSFIIKANESLKKPKFAKRLKK